MAGVVLGRLGAHLTVDKVFVVVQIAAVGGHAVITAQVLAARFFLSGEQCFIQLFPVARADDVRAGIAEQLLHGFGKVPNGGGGAFLHKQVAGVGVPERKGHKVHGFV